MTNSSESRIRKFGHASVLCYMYISFFFYKLTSWVYINVQQIAPNMTEFQIFIILVLYFENSGLVGRASRKFLMHCMLRCVLVWDSALRKTQKPEITHCVLSVSILKEYMYWYLIYLNKHVNVLQYFNSGSKTLLPQGHAD
jgi:hypothetical protein